MNRKNFHDSVVIERPTTVNISQFRTPRAELVRPWDKGAELPFLFIILAHTHTHMYTEIGGA